MLRALLLIQIFGSFALTSFSLRVAKPVAHPSISGAVIIGSGPTGLATAIMLAKRGYKNIKVYDKLSKPPSPDDASIWSNFEEARSYNIGLSGRGQNALTALGVMDRIRNYTVDVVGRKDWTPETKLDAPIEKVYTERTFPTRVLQRDRLTGALLDEIYCKYNDSVKIAFNTACESVDWMNSDKDSEMCRLTLKDMSTGTPLWFYEESAFVIGADGANSAVRESMARTSPKNKFSITRFEDKNVRLYRTIPLYFPEGSTKNWRKDLNWSVRLKSDINMDALPTKEGVYLGVVLYRPWDDRINLLKTKDDVKLFFTTYFPMFSQCMKSEDMETFAKKKPSTFSPFSYAGPDLHKGKTAVILGDCAHTVKPFFGLGVNSAFEDVVTLGRCLDAQQQSIPKALVSYSRSRGPESKALVTMSRQLDGGLLTFLLPLIVDSILHQFLPFIFSPNTIAAMQDEKKTYVGVARRKKIDRVLQLVFGTAIAAGIAKGFSLLAKCAQSLLRFRFGVGA